MYIQNSFVNLPSSDILENYPEPNVNFVILSISLVL